MIKRTKKLIKDTLWSISNASKGIALGFKFEKNFRIEFLITFFVFLFAFILRFNYIEWSVITLAAFVVLGGELFNTAIEESWDKLHPEHHESVGKIKDLASGAVLLFGLGAAFSGALIFIKHLF